MGRRRNILSKHLIPFVLLVLPAGNGSTAIHVVGSPWHVPDDKFHLTGAKAPENISISSNQGSRPVAQLKSMERVIVFVPVDRDAAKKPSSLHAWAELFRKSLENGGSEVLQEEWARTSQFESSSAVRMIVDRFQALPVYKIEGGRVYFSHSNDSQNRYASRRWREHGLYSISLSDPDYEVRDGPGRPDSPQSPPDLKFLSDVFLGSSGVFFLERSVSFILNEKYDPLYRGSGGCVILEPSWFEWIVMIAYSASTVAGPITVLYLLFRGLKYLVRRVCGRTLMAFLGWTFLFTTIPSYAEYSCSKEIYAPWFTAQISGKVEGSPGSFSGVTWNQRVLADRYGTEHMKLTEIWYTGPDALIAFEPANARLRASAALRSEWVKNFQENYGKKYREVELELMKSGVFETEQSVRFWYEQFGASPSFKIEAGKHYVSVPIDFNSAVSERKWRLSRPVSIYGNNIFSWRYDEREFVNVPNSPGRPALVEVPAPQAFFTDVLLVGKNVGFVQKTVTFGLNPAYERNLTDSGCGTSWARLLREIEFLGKVLISAAYFPFGLMSLAYWTYRLVAWFISKKKRAYRPPPPPTSS